MPARGGARRRHPRRVGRFAAAGRSPPASPARVGAKGLRRHQAAAAAASSSYAVIKLACRPPARSRGRARPQASQAPRTSKGTPGYAPAPEALVVRGPAGTHHQPTAVSRAQPARPCRRAVARGVPHAPARSLACRLRAAAAVAAAWVAVCGRRPSVDRTGAAPSSSPQSSRPSRHRQMQLPCLPCCGLAARRAAHTPCAVRRRGRLTGCGCQPSSSYRYFPAPPPEAALRLATRLSKGSPCGQPLRFIVPSACMQSNAIGPCKGVAWAGSHMACVQAAHVAGATPARKLQGGLGLGLVCAREECRWLSAY